MRILITGVTGFLGRHIAGRLLAEGHEVTGIARNVPAEPLPAGLRFLPASMAETAVLAPLIARSDWLVHLAWDGTPASSQGLPVWEISANVLPTAQLLEALQARTQCRVLFVSTGGALHAGGSEAANEQRRLSPRSYYGAAKGAVELMLQALSRQTGHRMSVLRPSNVYGPGQPARAGFGVIPALMRCAKDGLAFEVMGSGSTARDFLYIGDFLDIVGKTLAREVQAPGVEVLNAGSGTLVSIDALCEHMERITGVSITRHTSEARSVDPPQVLLDCCRAEALLGWQARMPIEEGLRLTWRWWRALP